MLSPILNLPNWAKTNGPLTSNQIGWLHSAECPLLGGFARSLTLASNNNPNYIASWFGFVGPEVRVRQVPGHLTAWTQGYGNPFGPGWEQEGYAAFTREQWLTPIGLRQLENLAQDMAGWARNHGVPARWLTTDEVQAVCFGGNRTIKGFAIHAQIANDRTDPGMNYPYDILINRIAQINGDPRTTGPRPPAHIEDNPAPDPLEETMAFFKDLAEFGNWLQQQVVKAPIKSTDGKVWPLHSHIYGITMRQQQAAAKQAAQDEVLRQILEQSQNIAIDYTKVEEAAERGAATAQVKDNEALAEAIVDEQAERLTKKETPS